MNKHLWQSAASFAARRHDGQKRKDMETPYVAHPFRVALIVRDVFGCEDEICLAAALLHDTIEDTKTDYDDLFREFGKDVADCVATLSKDMRLVEPIRETAYDRQLSEADWRARLVKLADQYDNLCESKDVAEAVKKCRRAIKIATADADAHTPTARAIEALELLIEEREGGS